MRAQKNKSTVYVRDGHRLLLVVGCFLSDLIAVEARPVVFFAIGFIDVFGIWNCGSLQNLFIPEKKSKSERAKHLKRKERTGIL